MSNSIDTDQTSLEGMSIQISGKYHAYAKYMNILTFTTLSKFNRRQSDYIFPGKQDSTFPANFFPEETICMKCHFLFPGKNKKSISIMQSAEKFTQRVLSVNSCDTYP